MRHRLTSVRTLLAGVAASSALLVSAPAIAAPAWLEHVNLSAADPGTGDDTDSANQNATAPRVAVDPLGDVTAIWARSDGVHTVIQSALRPAGGAWAAPLDLSGAGSADIPQVGVDAAGGAVAVWSQSDGTHVVVEGSMRTSAGAWQATPDVLSSPVDSAFAPALAVDARGDAVAVWTRYDDASGNQVVQVSGRPAGGAWEPPADLTTTASDASKPQVALDAQGDAVVVWTSSAGANQIVQASGRPAGGAWALPAQSLTTSGQALTPRIALSPEGAALAVWSGYDGAHDVVQASDGTVAGGWLAPVALSNPAADAQSPRVAVASEGRAVVVWQRPGGATTNVESAARAAAGTWQPAVVLSATGVDSTDPQVAMNAAGAAVAVWARARDTGTVVQAATSATPGAWTAGEDLTGAGAPALSPQVGIDAQGDGVALWTRAEEFGQVAQAKGHDVAGPLLPGLSIPATGTAGQATSFAVSPLDVWSALASTTWSFGDGTGADGAAVGHVYAAPGTYAVTVTSTDALGLASTATGSVTIAPGTPAPPPAGSTPATPAAPGAPSVAHPERPRISRVSLTHRRFRDARKLSAAARRARSKVPRGTTFRFTVSAPAKLTITFTRRAAGLRRGKACVAATGALRRRHARRCTRTITLGTVTQQARRAGAGSLTFGGRVRRHWLAPGTYRARLVAVNAGGRSAGVTKTFTVVR